MCTILKIWPKLINFEPLAQVDVQTNHAKQNPQINNNQFPGSSFGWFCLQNYLSPFAWWNLSYGS